jgi:LPS export ABC transporter protein LptC
MMGLHDGMRWMVSIGITGIVSGVLCCSLWQVGCADRSAYEVSLVDTTNEYPEQEIWGSTIVLSRDGMITSRIQAGHIARYKQKSETWLDSGVVVDFYGNDGRHTSRLTAKRGLVEGDQDQSDMHAWGNVVVVSDSGQTLETEAIRWDHAQDQIVSDTFVTITTELDTLYGFGLVSDGQLENWEIKKPTGKTVREFDLRREREAEQKTPSDATESDTLEAAIDTLNEIIDTLAAEN